MWYDVVDSDVSSMWAQRFPHVAHAQAHARCGDVAHAAHAGSM